MGIFQVVDLDMQLPVRHSDAAQFEVFVKTDRERVFVIQDFDARVPVILSGVVFRVFRIIIFQVPFQNLRDIHKI